MPESLPIAVAIIVAVVAAWDWARKDLQLAHGRMLSADRSQTFERAITALDLSNKQLDHGLDQLKQHMDGFEAALKGKADAATFASINDLSVVIEDMKLLDKRVKAVDCLKLDCSAYDDMRAGLTDWQKTCERSIELLQADIDKRDKAITNVAEEVAGLQRQQALALMGIAKTPKHGYAPGGPK